MKFDINKSRAIISKELNLSDIKILLNLIDFIDRSGFIVLTPGFKKFFYERYGMTRQTFHNSINNLYKLKLLLYEDGKTYYNKNMIEWN